jgi:hypothetical protein
MPVDMDKKLHSHVGKYKPVMLNQLRQATAMLKLCECRRFFDILSWHLRPTDSWGFSP